MRKRRIENAALSWCRNIPLDLTLLCSFSLLLVCNLLIPNIISIHWFIGSSVVASGIIMINCLVYKRIPEFDLFFDLPIILFGLYLLVRISLDFSEDYSIYTFMYWLFGYVVLKAFQIRITDLVEDSNLLLKLMSSIFIINIFRHFLVLFNNIEVGPTWNQSLGGNHNYTLATLTCFFPFYFFLQRKSNDYAGIVVFYVALFGLAIYTSSYGVILVLILLLAIGLIDKVPSSKRIIIFLLVVGVLIYFFCCFYILNIVSFTSRLDMMSGSVFIFFRNILFGAGYDGYYESFQLLNSDQLHDDNKNYTISMFRDHNFYFRFLGLYGIFGLLLIAPLIVKVIEGITASINDRNLLKRSAAHSIISFIIFSFFYPTMTWSFEKFSGLNLLFLFNLCLILPKSYTFSSTYFNLFLFYTCCTVVFVFSIFGFRKHLYNSTTNLNMANKIKVLNILVESDFQPYLGNYSLSYSKSKSISLKLANLHWSEGNLLKAKSVFIGAIEKDPLDLVLLLQYARFLIRTTSEFETIANCLNQVAKYQPDLIDLNLLFAELFIMKKEFANARAIIDNIDYYRYDYYLRILILESLLYFDKIYETEHEINVMRRKLIKIDNGEFNKTIVEKIEFETKAQFSELCSTKSLNYSINYLENRWITKINALRAFDKLELSYSIEKSDKKKVKELFKKYYVIYSLNLINNEFSCLWDLSEFSLSSIEYGIKCFVLQNSELNMDQINIKHVF